MGKKFRKITAIVLTVAMAFSVALPVFAENITDGEIPKVKTNLLITNPETGEYWEFDISNEVNVQQAKAIPFMVNDNIATMEIDVALGDYLAETYVITDEEKKTKTSDIILTTGLTYNRDVVSTGEVSIYTVFGSTTNVGSYYAENRKVSWRNPGADVGGAFTPTTSSWSYSVDSTSGAYNSNRPPFSLLECDVRISGMTSYRTVEVLCELEIT